MSLIGRRMLFGLEQEEEEMAEWKVLQEATAIGSDMNSIDVFVPSAKEVVLVFYGRVNNAEDSLSNNNDANSIRVNDVSAGPAKFTYIRPKGACFYTILRLIAENGYIDGFYAPKGNITIYATQSLLFGDCIDKVQIKSDNLFKAESTIAVYYR